jgi:type I restriction enzyme S subunit
MDDKNALSELPKGWMHTRLGDILTLEYGKGLRKDRRQSQGNVPVYGSNGLLGYHSVSLTRKPCLVIGRKGSVGSVHLSKVPCWPIDTTYFVEPFEGMDLTYLFYLLTTLNLQSMDKSTAIPGLNRNDAYALYIPIPPSPEQHRIVASIEEFFTKLDAAVEALKKIKVQLKRYRQAVLKSAFEGKLTAEWREKHKHELEPASVLLERIKEERKKRAKDKYKEIPSLDTSDLPQLPEGWVWTRLGLLFKWSNGKGLTKKQMRVGNYYVYGGNGMTGVHNKWLCAEECIIVGRVGAQCGNVHIAPPKSWITDNAIYTSWRTEQIYLKFFYYLLSDYGLNTLSGGSGQPYVSQAILNPLAVPLISVSEQRKVVQEIERLLSVADEVEKIVEQGLKQAKRLRQSILKKAFEGKLVPQDPSDEPAEKLLERIKAEKVKLEKDKNIKKTPKRKLRPRKKR